jgi:hypothetical protein
MGITVYRHISPIATGISRKMQVWIGLAMNWNNHLTKRLCISSIKGKSVSSSTCNNHIINQIKRIDCNIFPVVHGAWQLKLTWLPHVLWPFKPWNGHLHTSKRSLWTWAKHQPRSISLIATGSGDLPRHDYDPILKVKSLLSVFPISIHTRRLPVETANFHLNPFHIQFFKLQFMSQCQVLDDTHKSTASNRSPLNAQKGSIERAAVAAQRKGLVWEGSFLVWDFFGLGPGLFCVFGHWVVHLHFHRNNRFLIIVINFAE